MTGNGAVSEIGNKSSVLTFLAVITALLCIMKIVRLHILRHPAWHQYLIFYCASLECTIGGVHWVLVTYAQLDFVLQYLKLIQFLVMCHFYWTLATRALRREKLTKWFLMPFLFLVCVYFTVIATLGIVNVQPALIECLQPYWLELSGAEFATVQLFAVAGFYITRRLNEISTLDSVRWSQKRDLWCIVILLLPIWVMLFVFQPTPPMNDPDDLVPAISDDGNSVFSGIDDHQYRQLYHPSDDYHSFYDNSPSPVAVTQSASSNNIKKSASNLDPIKEESNQSNSEKSKSQNVPPQEKAPIDERETPPSQRGNQITIALFFTKGIGNCTTEFYNDLIYS
ncbi:hypothetical protein KUTeg_006884 [Tegillarca granosa]|uniref:Uncharacterized protein n=1 Tax=Tegillarca granosa TaxID=220873 RepID=A0ABQ9FBM0_TEGGR|nr:hypothetical protein KUTeg_006884 [Tegillarca granosa]